MKVLFLAQNVNIGADAGDSVHVRELVRNLANMGINVFLLASTRSQEQKQLSSTFNNPNIIIKDSKKHNYSFLASKLNLLSYIIAAYEYSPEIVYERGFSCKTGAIISKILRKPFIIEVNGLIDEELKILKRSKKHRITKHLRLAFRKYFFTSSNKIVVVTDGIKKELEYQYKVPSEKIVVIPNGANTELFRPMDKKEMRKYLNLSIESKYVCFVGNLAPWQGVENLIAAAPMVLKKNPEIKFLIVGDGVMKGEWERMTKEINVDRYFLFTGSVPFDVVPMYINASDVCVAPFTRSRNEKIGLSPLKIYEYMACSKPVIGSEIQGVGDILKKIDGGISVPPEKPIELADAIITLVQDEHLRIKMGDNGHKYVIDNHNWKITSKKVMDLCNSLSRENG